MPPTRTARPLDEPLPIARVTLESAVELKNLLHDFRE